jgi:uncharacterized protein (DUF1778 family)
MVLALPVVAAAVLRQLVQMAPLTQAVMEEMAPHRPFLEAALLMLAAAAAAAAQDQRVVLEAAAQAAEQVLLARQERPTPAVGLAEAVLTTLLEIPAAPASSSSNTTSALPRSSPSSHRRSGLHLRVR